MFCVQNLDDVTCAYKKREIFESIIGLLIESGSRRCRFRELNHKLTRLVTWKTRDCNSSGYEALRKIRKEDHEKYSQGVIYKERRPKRKAVLFKRDLGKRVSGLRE